MHLPGPEEPVRGWRQREGAADDRPAFERDLDENPAPHVQRAVVAQVEIQGALAIDRQQPVGERVLGT